MTGLEALVVAPILVPLAAAGLLVLLTARPPGGGGPFLLPMTARRGVAFTALAASTAVSAVLLAATADGAVIVQRLGNWPAGIAIPLAADAFGTIMLTVTGVLGIACLAFAAVTGSDTDRAFLPQSLLLLLAGVHGAYLTADLFSLFVFVEVMLVPSYVLIATGRGPERIAASRLYLTVNLLASTVFLAGLGLVYGVAGTVQLGDLAGRAVTDPALAATTAVILLALSVKAALVPLHNWLPRAYTAAPAAVTVLFSGLLTKVGVYALFRIYAVIYDGDPRFLPIVLVAALLTMVVGVLGAVGAGGMRQILTFHMVSQIGYIVLGLAISTPAGLAAAIYFLVQYVLVKAALLMVAGAVEQYVGTDTLSRLGGLAARNPATAVAFAVSALSLAGIPPLSGFVAKLALVLGAVDAGMVTAALVAVGVSVFTLLSMLKIWNGAFWGGDAPEPDPGGGAGTVVALRVPVRAVVPALALGALSLLLGLWAEPLLALSSVAGQGLADTAAYVGAVGAP
ncbi:monovalent cation/H+ antiporter subunit D family protein [Pseudonocardia sp. ICBG162]|uniref:monovalent cation/H+ antiporter subunit D family protein n=1 Tax=Pseudonocardia sp. ICBG162 TaxID=2846761 RepID=UPI001CF678F5|nr:monovalent cation/H+ antiporter subunit D family protein [Pseudonocardia sp. ICBG162]